MKKNTRITFFRKKQKKQFNIKKKQKKHSRKYIFSYHKICKTFIIVCLLLLFLFKYEDKSLKKIEMFNITQFFNTTIKSNSILIFENNIFHYECTPGYAKYFLDLGFNVDIIMTKEGKDIFTFFNTTEHLRLFILDNSKYYKSIEYIEKLRLIFDKYLAILVQTMNLNIYSFCKQSNLLKGKHSIFIYHHYYPGMPEKDFHNNKNSWTLLNFSNTTLEVNPHYFGNIKLRDKNKITKFLVVSTDGGRNYDQLLSATDKLKNENFQFQIIVTGRGQALSYSKIPNNIKEIFVFNKTISYLNLFKTVETVDFIIITLKHGNPGDDAYIDGKSTGSAQLSYGFLKPCLINSYFAETYGMNNNNSFIFNDSLYFSMRDAIKISNKEYKKKQYNLKKIADKIYEFSINNVKTTMNYILQKNSSIINLIME